VNSEKQNRAFQFASLLEGFFFFFANVQSSHIFIRKVTDAILDKKLGVYISMTSQTIFINCLRSHLTCQM
jgi:hypothetical protein